MKLCINKQIITYSQNSVVCALTRTPYEMFVDECKTFYRYNDVDLYTRIYKNGKLI